MRNALFALAILVPALVRADDRPYALINGRSAGTAATAAPRAPAPAPAAAPQTSVAAAPATEQRSTSSSNVVCTSGSQAAVGRRASGGRPQGHKSFWSGKRSADGSASGGVATTPTEDLPPHFSKPGALIRTEGQQPKYAKAEAARTHAVEGGSFVSIDNSKALDVGRAMGPHLGPKDALTTPNRAGKETSGGSSITPNSTINITNNTTTNGNQNGSGGKGDKHDNPGFGGGTGFDPAF
ncbi:MAG: hypothetical protein A2V88_14275 [Elusimicrobia bacterium RBG_16_66_12]|nr:MAG: hypothetical protein A2V88_14275 [Elusimicrobia bacterium RBG_16_66_12]